MNNYELYKNKVKKIADVNFAAAVLSWDQETMMPEKGGFYRSEQLSTLAGIAHELFSDPDFGNLLSELSLDNTLDNSQRKNVLNTLRDYQRQRKYNTQFVEKLSQHVNVSFQAWQKAKHENDFKIFEPFLHQMVDLKKQECDLLGYEAHPYDALLDIYEPGVKTKDLDVLFGDVKVKLKDYVAQIGKVRQNRDDFMYLHYDKNKQWEFSIYILEQLGYDFKSGRQDKSSHPFSTNFNAGDVRITTRVNENDLSEIIWSTIHEAGHALYEQGMLFENYGLPSGECSSLGIHESQSRLWENHVGRSLSFWKIHFPVLKQYFPENLADVTLGDFYKAMNVVKPSPIRTSADELTYHFHVMIRYEIEKNLIDGSIKVKDLPAIWKEKYHSYLGIEIKNDAEGVLQDVHWSHGSFGYFPTYSLGSFYASQFFQAAQTQMPELNQEIEKGEVKSLLNWLRKNIHIHGRNFSPSELLEKATGEKLQFDYFMKYASKKYNDLYNM